MKILIALILSTLLFTATTSRADGLDGLANVEHHPPDVMTSYSYVEDNSYTLWNKVWLTSMIVGQLGDVVSTVDALGRGCIEANPLFGEHPSTGLLVAAKVVVIGGIWYVTEKWLVPQSGTNVRNWVYGPLAIIGIGLTAHNSNVQCN